MREIAPDQVTRIRVSIDQRERLNALATASDRTQHGMLHYLISQEERRLSRQRKPASRSIPT